MKRILIFMLALGFSFSVKAQSFISFDSTNCPIEDLSINKICNFDSSLFFINYPNQRIYRFENNQWSYDSLTINNNYTASPNFLVKGRNHCLYAISDTAIFHWNGSDWVLELLLDPVLQNKITLIDKDTNFWFLPNNSNGQLLKHDKTSLTTIYLPLNLLGAIHAGMIDDSANIYMKSQWMYGGKGVIKYDGVAFTRIDTNLNVYWMGIDDQGKKWFINTDSLFQYLFQIRITDASGTTQIPFPLGAAQYPPSFATLSGNYLHFLTADSNNNYEIYYASANGIHSINLPSFLPLNAQTFFISTFEIDHRNRYWIAFSDSLQNRYLYLIDKGQMNIIRGKVFNDNNINGIMDAGEQLLPNVTINLMPGNITYSTGQNGEFEIALFDTTGSYQVTANLPAPWVQTSIPIQYIVNQTYQGQIDSGLVFGFASPPNIDIDLVANAGLFRLNSNGTYHFIVKNNSSIMLDSVKLSLFHDTSVLFGQAFPNATSYINPKVEWILDSLKVLEHRHIYSKHFVPISLSIGQTLSSKAILSYSNAFGDVNDTIDLSHIIMGPIDPNCKLEYHRNYDECVSSGDTLNYTINFQNCGNDTCFKVVLKDTLSPFLDLSTLHFTGASHEFTYQLLNGNLLVITFDSINLLDSNSNYYESMGFVKFSIAVGNYNPAIDWQLLNRAYIFFDYNAAVVTNFIGTILCNSLGISDSGENTSYKILPNPADKRLQIYSKQSIKGMAYSIFDTNGRLVDEGIFSESYQNLIRLDNLDSGIFIIEFEGGSKFKFVKNK